MMRPDSRVPTMRGARSWSLPHRLDLFWLPDKKLCARTHAAHQSKWPGSARVARFLPANPGLAGGGPAAYREDQRAFIATHGTPLSQATLCSWSRNDIRVGTFKGQSMTTVRRWSCSMLMGSPGEGRLMKSATRVALTRSVFLL